MCLKALAHIRFIADAFGVVSCVYLPKARSCGGFNVSICWFRSVKRRSVDFLNPLSPYVAPICA